MGFARRDSPVACMALYIIGLPRRTCVAPCNDMQKKGAALRSHPLTLKYFCYLELVTEKLETGYFVTWYFITTGVYLAVHVIEKILIAEELLKI